MRIGIIGGGILGLTAAHELLKQGLEVTIYEAAPEVGGQAGTFQVGPARLEKGYHHLFHDDTDLMGLLDEFGLSGRLQWLRSKMGLFYNGKVYPFGTPLSLLTFTPFNLVDRLRFGLLVLYLQRTKGWQQFEGITAKEWILKWGGRHIFDVVWGPLLRGKFGDFADQVSMTWFWGKIYLRGRSRGRLLQEELLGYIDGSWQVLIDAMERAILEKGGQILTSTRVRRILTSQGRVSGLEAQSSDGQISEQKLDAIIATIASPFIAQLSPDLPQEYRDRLTNTQYQAIVCVTLILKRALSDIYWTNISDPTMPFVGAIEQTNFIPPETYGGRHILYLSNYVAQGSRLTKLSPEEILAEYLPSLRRINPAFREDWVEEYRFFRDFAGQPVIGTNYSQRLLPHRTPLSGLYLANTTQIYPEDRGTNYSARLGKQVAKVIWEDVQTGALGQAGGLVGKPT